MPVHPPEGGLQESWHFRQALFRQALPEKQQQAFENMMVYTLTILRIACHLIYNHKQEHRFQDFPWLQLHWLR